MQTGKIDYEQLLSHYSVRQVWEARNALVKSLRRYESEMKDIDREQRSIFMRPTMQRLVAKEDAILYNLITQGMLSKPEELADAYIRKELKIQF